MAQQQQQQKGVLLSSAAAAPTKLAPGKHAEDKENIDPGSGMEQQPHTAGFPGCGVFGGSTAKPFGGNTATNSAKGRTPLADITALCMLQTGLPPKQQQQPSAGQKGGLWGATSQGDKTALGGPAAASGGASAHRLSVMR